jgi:hypothetical protein
MTASRNETALVAAARTVARDFGLPDEWLNPGPTSLLDLGVPKRASTSVPSVESTAQA